MKTSKNSYVGLVSLFLAICLCVSYFNGQERKNPSGFGSQKPLAELLNSDGTLKVEAGGQGSFDPRGFRMVSGPGEQPRFLPAGPGRQAEGEKTLLAAGDENWDTQFGNFYTNGFVSAIAVIGTDVYVGGSFTQVGNSARSYLARWDGSAWADWNPSLNNAVYALVASGTDLYIGGAFTQVGGQPMNYIAKYDTSAKMWSNLGGGAYGNVYAIAVRGMDVFAGGYFSIGGSNPFIAKWDGAIWSAVGSGVDGEVRAIAVTDTYVYAGGWFTHAGGNPANYIARWDGMGWSALGAGENGVSGTPGNTWVEAIVASGGYLYAGGYFTGAGGHPANSIARWDGANWSSLGMGVNNPVNAIAVSGADVYLGGNFTTAGGGAANHIAKWSGTAWLTLGSGVSDSGSAQVSALTASGSDLYAGGSFTRAGGNTAHNIAKWNGTSWLAQGDGLNNWAYAIAVSGTDVYVGGRFTEAGGSPVSYIAKWDTITRTWSALGSGVGGGTDPFVRAIAVSGTDVYVGGAFTTAGGSPASNIAKWNGTAWAALGGGVNGAVYAITVSGTDVYVGGSFTNAGGPPANYIARWSNATGWSALGNGLNAEVKAIAVRGADVFVGGYFTLAGESTVNYIAKWNGVNGWSDLAGGVTGGRVYALAVNGPDVYVGGDFIRAGGIPIICLAIWNETTGWSAPPSSPFWTGSYTDALAMSGTDLYVGLWDILGPNLVRKLDTFAGTWSLLGSGLGPQGDSIWVYAVTATGADVYLGGRFRLAGLKSSSYFGHWMIPLAVTAPNGGEIWEPGTSHAITWKGGAGSVKIEYSTDNGTTWLPIVGSTENDGTYLWPVPNTSSSQCSVRISEAADGNPVDTSDGTFSIAGFRLTYPNGGEQWISGTLQTITWETIGSYPTVRIELSTNNGSTWMTITSGTANSGSYPWTVAEMISSSCLIRVSDSIDSVPFDASDTVFSIIPAVIPTIAVTSPNGGESWATGSIRAVTWTQTGLTGLVTIDLYKGGVFKKTLGMADATIGTFAWPIGMGEMPGTDYRVLIWQGGISDNSDANFTLVRKVKVDFNKDGQEDLLWRCYGTGESQGSNLVWFMTQTEGLSPLTLGGALNIAGVTNLITGSTPGKTHLNPLDVGNVQTSGPGRSYVSPMDVGNELAPKQKKLMRGAADISGLPSRGNSVQIRGRDLAGNPVLQDVVGLAAGDVGTMALNYSDAVLYNVLDTAWEIAGAGDFDGDGNTDILWRYYGVGQGQGTTIIWYMNGTTVTGQGYPVQVSDTDWRIDRTGDFNGDGKTDILWRYYGSGGGQGTAIIWCMDGANIIGQLYPPQVWDTDWKIEGIGDFDGDGRADLLWRYYGTGAGSGTTIIWYMDGITVIGQDRPTLISDTDWRVDTTGDFNRDGKADIVWRYYGTGAGLGATIIWYMDGATILGQDRPYWVQDLNWRIVNR